MTNDGRCDLLHAVWRSAACAHSNEHDMDEGDNPEYPMLSIWRRNSRSAACTRRDPATAQHNTTCTSQKHPLKAHIFPHTDGNRYLRQAEVQRQAQACDCRGRGGPSAGHPRRANSGRPLLGNRPAHKRVPWSLLWCESVLQMPPHYVSPPPCRVRPHC